MWTHILRLSRKLFGVATMTDEVKLNGIRATWDGCELDMSMSLSGLSELTDCFRKFAYGTYQFGAGSSPSSSAVTTMDVQPGEGKLRLALSQGRASFVGSKEAMSLLADNMAGLLSLWAAGGDQHFHFDPSSDQLLLKHDSPPCQAPLRQQVL